jgi:hypothetical protein
MGVVLPTCPHQGLLQPPPPPIMLCSACAKMGAQESLRLSSGVVPASWLGPTPRMAWEPVCGGEGWARQLSHMQPMPVKLPKDSAFLSFMFLIKRN